MVEVRRGACAMPSRPLRGTIYMFVPVFDHNPLRRIRFQYVTVALILLNALVYLWEIGMAGPVSAKLLTSMTVIPGEFVRRTAKSAARGLHIGAFTFDSPYTLITYMFLHGSWMHLIGNMVFLWVFGDNVEDAMGHVRFLIFYLLCGVLAALAHVGVIHLLLNKSAPEFGGPLIGASGAVAGVIGAYLMLHPRVRVWVLVLFRIPLRVSAGFALLAWAGFQIFSAYYDYVNFANLPAQMQENRDITAWWAHIGGMLAGAILVIFMRRDDVELFDRATGLEPKASIFNPNPPR